MILYQFSRAKVLRQWPLGNPEVWVKKLLLPSIQDSSNDICDQIYIERSRCMKALIAARTWYYK